MAEWAAYERERKLTSNQRRALEIIRDKGPILGKNLATQLGITAGAVRSHVIPGLRPCGVKDRGKGYYLDTM